MILDISLYKGMCQKAENIFFAAHPGCRLCAWMLRFQLRCFHFHWLFVLLQGATSIVSCCFDKIWTSFLSCFCLSEHGLYRGIPGYTVPIHHLDKLDCVAAGSGVQCWKSSVQLSVGWKIALSPIWWLPFIAAKTIPFHGKVINKWIHDDTWWYMMIHDDTWWYMMIHDDTWWYMMIHVDIGFHPLV